MGLMKTRMQIVNPSPTAVYSGISNAMLTISRVEGFRTLWRGVSSVVLGAGPAHAVYFATYEAVKHAMGGNAGAHQEHHPLAAAVSGASATIASDALMNPFDVIKQRMQLQNSTYRTVGQCASDVFRKEGLKAFYVSYPTTLAMTVPFTAIQFTVYESSVKVLNPGGKYDPYTHCFAGGIRWCCSGYYYAIGCDQDAATDEGNGSRCGIAECEGTDGGCCYYQETGWLEGLFQGTEAENCHDDA